MLKNTVSILGISMTYILNKVLKMKKSGFPTYMPQANLPFISAKIAKYIRAEFALIASE